MATATIEKAKTNYTPDATAERDAFLSPAEFDVTLTYEWTKDPIVFPCRQMLNTEEKEARLKFYAQPDEDQEAGKHSYHVEMLASILSGRPRGLPGYDAILESTLGDEPKERLRDALRIYLKDPRPRAIQIAADAIERYARMSQPKEFFR
jgi:hypothetical protein